MTRITLENENGKFQVEIEAEELYLSRIISDVVAPVLMAAGYHDQQVKDFMYLGA